MSPKMVELPNELRLRRLPLRALVAYAARCAERILPHASFPRERRLNSAGMRQRDEDSDTTSELTSAATRQTAAANEAVLLALKFAAGKEVQHSAVEAAERSVLKEIMRLMHASSDAERRCALVVNCAYAAINAVSLILNSPAVDATAAHNDSAALNAVGENVVLAAFTAADAASTADERVIAAAASDYEILDLMCAGAYPQLGRGVDISITGPLGPLFKTASPPRPDNWREKSPSLQQLGKVESQISELREALSQERAGRKRDADVAARDRRQFNQRIAELEAAVDGFAAERQTLQQESSRRESELQQTIDDLNTELATARKDLEALQTRLDTAAHSHEDVSRREAEWQADRDTWNRERDAWQAERDEWASERDALLQQLAERDQRDSAWAETQADHRRQLQRLQEMTGEFTAVLMQVQSTAVSFSHEDAAVEVTL